VNLSYSHFYHFVALDAGQSCCTYRYGEIMVGIEFWLDLGVKTCTATLTFYSSYNSPRSRRRKPPPPAAKLHGTPPPPLSQRRAGSAAVKVLSRRRR